MTTGTRGTPPTAPPRPPASETRRAPIDPRFRQRRIEVKRLEGRRRLRVILILAGFAFVALAGWGLSRSPLLDVDHVRVSGATRTSPASVAQASGVDRGMAMFDVDVGAARRRVAALPWVLRAQVQRHWPGRVTIQVQERVPVAVVAARSGFAVVDATGRVVTVAPAPPAGLVQLLGLPPAGVPGSRVGGRAADLLAVVKAAPAAVLSRITGVVAAGGGQVELRVRPTGTVLLGAPDQLAAKLLATETVFAQVDLTRLVVLDVRVPASPAITRA